MEKDYSNAYSEVLEVLKYIPKEDYDKIPKKTIRLLEKNYDEKSEFRYNIALPFEEQGLSKDAKIILAILHRNCWATEEEKIQIRKEEIEYIRNIEETKKERYNPDNIFKNREKHITKELEENHYITIQKKKWYQVFFEKISDYLKRRK